MYLNKAAARVRTPAGASISFFFHSCDRNRPTYREREQTDICLLRCHLTLSFAEQTTWRIFALKHTWWRTYRRSFSSGWMSWVTKASASTLTQRRSRSRHVWGWRSPFPHTISPIMQLSVRFTQTHCRPTTLHSARSFPYTINY